MAIFCTELPFVKAFCEKEADCTKQKTNKKGMFTKSFFIESIHWKVRKWR